MKEIPLGMSVKCRYCMNNAKYIVDSGRVYCEICWPRYGKIENDFGGPRID